MALIRLAKQYGRYGYRKIAELLRIEGWKVNHKKVERIWCEEGLQLPQRHKKRRRLYHKDSSIIRLRPTHPNHVWSIDFVHDKLGSGRSYKMLTVLDEYTRQALAVAVRTRMGADDVLEALYPLLLRHGIPEHIRIYPGSPWESGYNERFNGTLCHEVLNAEWFTTTKQAQIVINHWLRQYNRIRPHQALNMRPPVPETLIRNGTEHGGLDIDKMVLIANLTKEEHGKLEELVANGAINADMSSSEIFDAFGKEVKEKSETGSSAVVEAIEGYMLPSQEELAAMATNDLEAFIHDVTDPKRMAELFLQGRETANDVRLAA